jgi:hypothetical protein
MATHIVQIMPVAFPQWLLWAIDDDAPGARHWDAQPVVALALVDEWDSQEDAAAGHVTRDIRPVCIEEGQYYEPVDAFRATTLFAIMHEDPDTASETTRAAWEAEAVQHLAYLADQEARKRTSTKRD